MVTLLLWRRNRFCLSKIVNPDFRNPHNVNQKMIFKIGIVSTLTPAVRRPRSTQPNPTHIPGEQGAQSRVTSVSQFARAGEVIARTVSSLRSPVGRSIGYVVTREITRRTDAKVGRYELQPPPLSRSAELILTSSASSPSRRRASLTIT